jgi:hypothetical protein
MAALWAQAAEAAGRIAHDAAAKTLTIATATGELVLRVRYDHRCFLDQMIVGGRNVVDTNAGVCSAVKAGGRWSTTRVGIPTPAVHVVSNTAVITEIMGGGGELPFREKWRFDARAENIVWRLEREYLASGMAEDICLPGWGFLDLSTWTGALLDHGGVAWCRLFDVPEATYGVHTGELTFWKRGERTCLQISPNVARGKHVATRFSRQTDGVFRVAHAVTEERLASRHGLRRFLRDRQDVWAPWPVRPGVVAVELTLQARTYEQAFARGRFRHFNGDAIREILHTIARIGAIDDEVMGSNGYYSGYAVLHEPWIAQLGLAIDDPAYFRAYSRTLDFQRDHAIGPDGRVKSRWSYDSGDAMPGTYDRHGFYECQWGWLLDSQPSYVINVAEQFDFTGDRAWLRRHQTTCEKALAYLLQRDRDGDGLVEMMTDSHRAAKGSDWIDIIWAAHENAFVNAQLYHALVLWAGVEEVLGDDNRAQGYRRQAAKLKDRFNVPTDQGGLWNSERQWYVHWRDQDDTVHGDNLVVPVNFMAIAYGLCEPEARARAILEQVEKRMQREGLFFWPLCFESYQPGEGAAGQFPFPNYENGDIFLAWGETGTRAYARFDPGVAVKYIKNVLDQYERDGLICQRYLRKTQQGTGGDLLANNCSPVVGLYRNIYGIQPKWNRLFLDPQLTPELNGTQVRYWLRGQTYELELTVNDYRLAAHGFTWQHHGAFAANIGSTQAEFFPGTQSTAGLTLTRAGTAPLEVRIGAWPTHPGGARGWTVIGGTLDSAVGQTVSALPPNAPFRLSHNGVEVAELASDARGCLAFTRPLGAGQPDRFELQPK